MKKNKFLIILVGVGVFVLMAKLIVFYSGSWWKFSTRGEIYNSPAIYKGWLFFGNNIGEFFAIDNNTGKEKWVFNAEHEIQTQPIFYKGEVIFSTADGTIYALKAKNGEELWRFSSDDFYRFYLFPEIRRDTLLAFDAAGKLYAINTKTGKTKWKFASSAQWFGSLAAKGNKIYFGSRDGSLYALSWKDGSLLWKFDSEGPVTTGLEISGGRVYFGNKNGESFAINLKNGRPVWRVKEEGASVVCLQPYKKFDPFYFKSPGKFNLKTFFSNYPFRSFAIEVRENGDILKRSDFDADEIWRIKTGGVTCASNWHEYFYFADAAGNIRAINEKEGTEAFLFKADGVKSPPMVSYRQIQFDPFSLKLLINTPLLFFGDAGGNFYALKARSGREVWRFKTFGGVYSFPIIIKNRIYFTATDGGVYRLSLLSGKPPVLAPFAKIEVSQNTQRVGENDIIELTITHDDKIYTNPWREIEISTDFTHESGKKVPVNGFYFDKNTWKVRFNPPEKGRWKWSLEFKSPFRKFEKAGEFISSSDTHASFIKTSEENPKRLTLDQVAIFNGLGIQDSIMDFNGNGNPFDDWAIEEDLAPQPASSKQSLPFYRSNRLVDLSTYLKTYGPEGAGFNIYRWPVNNASFSLWSDFGIDNRYLIRQGKWGDSFISSLKDAGFQVWLSMFSFGIPFGETQSPIEIKAILDYINYVVARYGAYVNIWEIANEAYIDDPLVELLARHIRGLDYEGRPISMSWERPELENIDIISPHWYQSEDLGLSDWVTVQQIEKYKKYPKPVVFGEQGNEKASWDQTSSVRMRVRSWASFFNEAVLIFWNQSDSKNFYNAVLKNANIYIGEEERGFVRILQDFTKNVDLSAKIVNLPTNNPSVRSYGLESKKELLGYFFHYGSPNRPTSFSLTLDLANRGKLIWLDPSTGGKTIGSYNFSSRRQQITSPIFFVDLAFKIIYD